MELNNLGQEKTKALEDLKIKNDLDEAKPLIPKSGVEDEKYVIEKKKPQIQAIKEINTVEPAGEEEDLIPGSFEEANQQNLEQIAASAPSDEESQEQGQYQAQLAQQPMEALYSQARDLYSTGPEKVGRGQFESAMDLKYAMQEKKEAIRSGSYSVDAFIDREIDATLSMAEKIIDWYKG